MTADSLNGRLSKRRKLSHSSSGDNSDDVQPDVKKRDSDEEDSDEEFDAVPVSNSRAKTALTKTTRSNAAAGLANGGASKASVLSLQLGELVAEMTPKYDSIVSKANANVERIKAAIKLTSDIPAMSLADAEKHMKAAGNIAIPFPQPRPAKDALLKFEYQKPSSISVCGATAQKLSIRDGLSLTITATMPVSLFQEKDYLNYRAFYKRSFYLACIASALVTTMKEDFDVSYRYKDGIDLIPTLRLATKTNHGVGKIHQELDYIVNVAFPAGVFPVDKTTPLKNCVRSITISDGEPQQPTPFYNSCLQAQASYGVYDDMIANTIQCCTAFADATRAGQIWLRQRGFSSNCAAGGFGYWEWTVICALLLKTGGHRGQPLFSERYSTLQLFKAMLQVLATRDLLEPMVIDNDNNLQLPKSEHPVFYDGKTGTNILFKMTAWSYQSLRNQAQISLVAVNSKQEDSFDDAFIARVSEPLLQYDEVFAYRLSKDTEHNSSSLHKTASDIYKVMKRGLGDRVVHLNLKIPTTDSWSTHKPSPSLRKQEVTIEISLLLNAETQSRMVDHGPSADEKDEAADFRRFWGDKAELRRFKDGSISESIVWSSNQPVTLQIIQHLMSLHFRLPSSSIVYKSRNLINDVLPARTSLDIGDAFKAISNKFQQLSSTLHRLEDLPLPIRSVFPADPALRSASLQNPLQPSTVDPIGIIIQFDSSTRWPDSLPAIQHTKIAFLLKLGDLLTANDTSLTTRVGLENTSTATTGYFNTSYLDIIFPSPAPGLSPICFRARIYHDRETQLLQTAVADKSIHGAIRDSLTSALATHKRDYQAKPLHTNTLRSLCTRFPPLSSTIRLLKKWISSHLLLHHTPPELLELIAAHIFLRPSPWSTPGSPTTAFLRCLHLLANWDWPFRPLIIDTSQSRDLDEYAIQDLQTRFQAWRKLDPNMNNIAWFVGSNLDNTGVVWTQGSRPPKVVAGRVTALARAAMDVVKVKGTDMTEADWRGLFTSSLDDFDFQIKLKSSVVRSATGIAPNRQSNGIGAKTELVKYKNLQIEQSLSTDTIGFDPVELFRRDLERAFGNAAVFFYNRDGGRVIAGLWKPGVLGQKEWRVRLGYSSALLAEEGRGQVEDKEQGEKKVMCEFNKAGVLAEIAMLGEGLVKEIVERKG